MDSDYEKNDSDDDFRANPHSCDESLVLEGSMDEDELISPPTSHSPSIDTPHFDSPSNIAHSAAKKRSHDDVKQPPKPSGWITAYKGKLIEISDDEEELLPKRQKLTDLDAARSASRDKLPSSASTTQSVNTNGETSDVDVLELSPTVSPRTGPKSTTPHHIPSKTTSNGASSHQNAEISRSATQTPLDDDILLLSDSDDDPVPRSSTSTPSGIRRLKRPSSVSNSEMRAPIPVKKAPKPVVQKITIPDAEGDGWASGDEIDDDGEEYQDVAVKFERIFSAAEKIATSLQRDLDRYLPATSSGSSSAKKPLDVMIQQPTSLSRALKDYQVVGLNWLRILHCRSLNGILADEMGLGKTIQTIAFLCWLREMREEYLHLASHGGVENAPSALNLNDVTHDCFRFSEAHNDWPTLIVAPASTIANWHRELQIWAPSMRVLVFHGSLAEREEIKDDVKLYWKRYRRHSFDVIISTYHLVGGKHDSAFFKNGVRFNYLVVDEAQMLKGRKTARYSQLMQIRAVHRLLLTGTPLQNNLDELQSLLGFLMPKLFGKLLEVSLRNELLELSKQGKKVSESEYVLKLKTLLSPFILRRLKSQVGLGLLPKIHETLLVQPTDTQKQLTQQLFEHTSATLRATCLQSSPDGPPTASLTPNPTSTIDIDSENSDDSTNDTISLTAARDSPSPPPPAAEPNIALANVLMQLRKSANHPIFVRAFYTPAQIQEIGRVLFERKHKSYKGWSLQEILQDLEFISDWQLHQLVQIYPSSLQGFTLTPEQLFETSAKLQCLATLLPRLRQEGHRVVLFSQFTMVLDVLELFLEQKLRLGYKRLDGSTPVADRQAIMDEFNENVDNRYFLFLASTLAGGLGVNLTSADTVIFFDISFNPHVDRQAEDRCHRLGQTKQVTVYKMIVPGTIEEHMHRMATAKTELNDIMLNEGSYAAQEAIDEMVDADESVSAKKKTNSKARNGGSRKAELMFMKQVALSMTSPQTTP